MDRMALPVGQRVVRIVFAKFLLCHHQQGFQSGSDYQRSTPSG
jgi:hypothetical protein